MSDILRKSQIQISKLDLLKIVSLPVLISICLTTISFSFLLRQKEIRKEEIAQDRVHDFIEGQASALSQEIFLDQIGAVEFRLEAIKKSLLQQGFDVCIHLKILPNKEIRDSSCSKEIPTISKDLMAGSSRMGILSFSIINTGKTTDIINLLAQGVILSLIVAFGFTFFQLSFLHKKLVIPLINKIHDSERDSILASTSRMLAHDLSGPLLLFRKLINAESAQAMWSMKNEVRSSLNRVESLVESFKHKDIQSMVKPSWNIVNWKDLTEELSLLSKLNDKIFYHPTLDSGEIYLDLSKVERVIHNLVDNAFSAAKSEVYLNIRRGETDLVIEVVDDGEGVPQGSEYDIFKAGYTVGKDGGTGLGLSFVRKISKGHGGDTKYFRKDNKTHFECTFPNCFKVTPSERSPTVIAKRKEQQQVKVLISLDDKNLTSKILNNFRNTPNVTFIESKKFSDENIVVTDCSDILSSSDGHAIQLHINGKDLEKINRKILFRINSIRIRNKQ